MIFAIDPGSEKTGTALVNEDGTLFKKKIIPTDTLEDMVGRIMSVYNPRAVVIGNGTHHQELKQRVEQALLKSGSSLKVSLVNEKYTTEMGKRLYWKENRPHGWNRLLPAGMRTIPVPVDDYVAWIIGCIFLGCIKAESINHKKTR